MVSDHRLWTPLELIQVTADFLAEKGIQSPRLDSELLLAHVLELSRLQLYLEHERPIVPLELDRFRALVRRRSQRVPLQLLLGEVEILGHRFAVREGVFIPRQDTETLLQVSMSLPFPADGPGRILEVGCGTGCIGLSLLLHWPRAELTAWDSSELATELTLENARQHGLQNRCAIQRADAQTARLPQCELLVSNPPYIPSSQIDGLEPEVREHDPRGALDGGADGLDLIRVLAERGFDCLVPGGWLALEHGYDQGDRASAILREAGFADVELHRDLAGHPRVTVGRRAVR